jgi:hypothetical protein
MSAFVAGLSLVLVNPGAQFLTVGTIKQPPRRARMLQCEKNVAMHNKARYIGFIKQRADQRYLHQGRADYEQDCKTE